MKRTILLASAFALLLSCSPEGSVKFVDEFDLSKTVCGQGLTTQTCKSVDGDTLKVGGKTYERGVGVRPEGAVIFESNGKVAFFDAVVGVDEGNIGKLNRPNAAFFKVWADGKVVWNSGLLKASDGAKTVHVDLSGVREIALETASGSPWVSLPTSNGDWIDARFTLEKGGRLKLITNDNDYAQLGILTPEVAPQPQFNGADIWGVRPGHPVIFRVPVSGEEPIKFTAEGLPEGVTFDTEKGILGGVAPAIKGNYDIKVTAENAKGKAERTIRLAVGDEIALTPPLGWNSWNIYVYKVTDQKVREAASAMEDSGLGNYGFSYINIDDWWEMNNTGVANVAKRQKELGTDDVTGAARDADGRILPNRSFPDMKALTDYIHSFGFKAGIYSSPGALTCGRCEGSLGHEMEDATSWAEWGFDYIKYDLCSYRTVLSERLKVEGANKREEYIRPYAIMNECLKQQNRDIIFAFCQYGDGDVQEWARENGANCWRNGGDLKDGWTELEMAIDSKINGEYYKYSGPGCWVDPDMMTLGTLFTFGYNHPSLLTPNEQYTHMSVWAMICAPILLGCDLGKFDDFTLSLLRNREVIAIHQDRLGSAARRYRHEDAESVWARPLSNGDWAIALVNRYPKARTIAFDLKEIGLEGTYDQRDVWRQADEGRVTGTVSAQVPPHATKLIRLHCTDCPKCE